ncbi:MAG TPA: serine/threonine-protein kinase, partial [Acidobacteriota bacterium]|nr:serine/threonine-protein kinase [Acidobacteriota bacterium]
MIGKILSHYRILQKLGAGGMGEVYLAEDMKLRRRVAIKIPPADIASDSDRMRRFVLEARAASALNHPNIASIYELGDAEGIPFIAMELIEGRTLQEAMSQGPFPEERILEIAIQTADALQEAHAQGIIHRDIKPANLMLNSKGQLKVLDFGLAKLRRTPSTLEKIEPEEDTATRTGVLLGTIHYLSPEQALGRNVDCRSDIFSFGTVLYQLATGEFPFSGDNMVQMIESILHSEPSRPRTRNPLISEKLEGIIMKCLEKDPARRFQNAGQLLEELRAPGFATVRVLPARARRAGGPETRWMVTAAVLVAVIASVMLYWRLRPAGGLHAIAVLPFANLGNDADTEYLTDGLTDSIINSLSQLPNMKVLARGTVFKYKGQGTDALAVGKKLDVDAVVTGDVSLYKQHLIVRTSLVRVRDGAQIWGDQYDMPMTDLLQMQSRISGEISSRLSEKLTGEQRAQITKRFTQNVDAYQLYLKGV